MEENLFKKVEYFLYSYKEIDILNQLADIKIKKLKNDITLSASTFDERTGPTNAFSSTVENEVIKREETVNKVIDKLEKEKQQRLSDKDLINKSLELLDDDEIKLIKLRYFSKPTKSWTSIALELNQSVDNCIKTRRKVINKLSEVLF